MISLLLRNQTDYYEELQDYTSGEVNPCLRATLIVEEEKATTSSSGMPTTIQSLATTCSGSFMLFWVSQKLLRASRQMLGRHIPML